MLLILHETVRIAQMFRPWMSSVNNSELYELVDAIDRRQKVIKASEKHASYLKNLRLNHSPSVLDSEIDQLKSLREQSLLQGNVSESWRLTFQMAELKSLKTYKKRRGKPPEFSREILKLRNDPAYYIETERELLSEIDSL